MQRTIEMAPAESIHPSILIPASRNNASRWKPGQRLFDLFEARCGALAAAGALGHSALDVAGAVLSYGELRARVRAHASAYRTLGLKSGDRVGLILNRSLDSYCAMLGAVCAQLAYVPLDPKFPADRVAFIAKDAAVDAVVVVDEAAEITAACDCRVLQLSALTATADACEPDADFETEPRGSDTADALAYIIYTSGSTGRPKGVAVNHSAICNFITVAAEEYGYQPSDRVYQGLTFAFDFSIEEFWVPLAVGATLVASPSNLQLVGRPLESFLRDKRITALCCVPTLLATLENDLPALRFVLVSGEACPQDLVKRWHRHDRRLLNAYGPTEATVTATWTVLAPDRKVTIGVPLTTYSIAILEPGSNALTSPGATGEIAIGGVGLAVGYVNRPDLTAEKFIPDFLELENNPARRLYRTGDLGRINEDGEIEYLGRIDTQVKLKGYRIELGEIEEVMLEIDGVAQAVVNVWQDAASGTQDLVGYYTSFEDTNAASRETVAIALRTRLPSYMVPAFIEPIDAIPLMPSQKADRKALPPPRLPRVTASSRDYVPPSTPSEIAIANCLAAVLGIEQVSATHNFFEDLGLDSLGAARFVMALDDALDDTATSIANVYLQPTVRDLARVIDNAALTKMARARAAEVAPVSNLSHAICGALQAASYTAILAGYAWLLVAGVSWVALADGSVSMLLRSAQIGVLFLILPAALAIATKWAIIGRWKEERIPLWGFKYFKFWLVRLLIETSPLSLFRGSPVFNIYLRLLGAKVGRNVLILSKTFPLCTDLISIGDNAVLRKDCHLTGYRAHGTKMMMAPIRIGQNAVVGEGAVVDIDTTIEADGQLAHASALLSGQSIPEGDRAYGVPARPTEETFANKSDHAPSPGRRVAYGILELFSAVVFAAIILSLLVAALGTAVDLQRIGTPAIAVTFTTSGIAWLAAVSLFSFLALIGVGLLLNTVVSRLLNGLVSNGKSHPNYGSRYYFSRLIVTLSNIPFFHALFGDSSYVVHYVKALGFKQPELKQTGSNFGTSLYQDNPSACSVGPGTMISDNLYFINFSYGSSSFASETTRLGRNLFLGNKIYYPATARIGDNCLLASKVMVPTHGEFRENTGLLGSPSFEIPRTTRSAIAFNPVPETAKDHARLSQKNSHNLATIAIFLTANWLSLFAGALASYATLSWFGALTAPALVASAFAWFGGTTAGWVIQERLTLLGGPLKPTECTIHDPDYWHVERHWKLGETPLKYAFKGTPFRPLIYRLLGVSMGARVFDDGGMITEKTLTTIGDDTCINADAYIQAHSLEDGLFKSDRIVVGPGTTIGPNAYVHYGVTMGNNTELQTDAFLMKGTKTEPRSVWSGNPAAVI